MKHLFHEAIVAWANGEEIQFKTNFTDTWHTLRYTMCPDFNRIDTRWRIKPKTTTVTYRLALVDVGIDDPVYEITAYHKHTGYKYDNVMPPRAVKWITDWIEYEITE